ncbi:MAG: BON domain-containing protein [Chitinivibrionales bacterium]
MSRRAEEIKRDVIEQLDWDDRIKQDDIQVEYREGSIHLSGTTHSYVSKMAAEYDAWSVAGVLSVDNDIVIKPEDQTLEDEHIRRHVMHLLMWSPSINANDISASVTGGTVILRGTVDAYWKKVRAAKTVADVHGVMDVINRLTVVPSHDIVDESIAENIIDALGRIKGVEVGKIDIEVNDGHVHLQGSVPDWNAFRAVENIVYGSTGIRDVTNDLLIR